MEKRGNFLLMDRSEFRGWLAGQKITRKITKLQVHHTASPNYTTRRIVSGVAFQDHFDCLEGMRRYHLSLGWSGTGQNITTFEDGKIAISLDRNLNVTPAGISGANTGALCIENVGNFDNGGDTLTPEQRMTIVHLYACLCEKLGLAPSVSTIVYHAWYKADGTWLGDYVAGKSSKTCPGTNFFGAGNTKAAAQNAFIPAVAAELANLKNGGNDVKKDVIVSVKVDGVKVGEGVMDAGVTYIPVRAVAEALGAYVAWDSASQTVIITKGAN